jgi:chorismate-pyruvate lyase
MATARVQSEYGEDPLSLPVLLQHEREWVSNLELVKEEHMPDPYQWLLCHSSNMTPRLCEFHQVKQLQLTVLHSNVQNQEGEVINRIVLLKRKDNAIPVEFGAIQIYLDNLPESIKDSIRTGSAPLGALLLQAGVRQECHPQCFVKVSPNANLLEVLEIKEESDLLYGRMNVIVTPEKRLIAQVFEILPNITTATAGFATKS